MSNTTPKGIGFRTLFLCFLHRKSKSSFNIQFYFFVESETTLTEKSAVELVQEEKQKKEQAEVRIEQQPKPGLWHRIHEALQKHPFYGPGNLFIAA
jgi:hypothetical protein